MAWYRMNPGGDDAHGDEWPRETSAITPALEAGEVAVDEEKPDFPPGEACVTTAMVTGAADSLFVNETSQHVQARSIEAHPSCDFGAQQQAEETSPDMTHS